jgi:hypothetical protein
MRKIAINSETQKRNASHNLPVISKGLLIFYDTPCSTKVTMKKYVKLTMISQRFLRNKAYFAMSMVKSFLGTKGAFYLMA